MNTGSSVQFSPMNEVFYKSSLNMVEVSDATVDLILTSPPYYRVKNYSWDGRQEWVHSELVADDCGAIEDYSDYIYALLQCWRECYRVLKPNGKLVVNAPVMPMPKRLLHTHHNRHVFNIYSDIEHSILSNIADFYLLDIYIWNRTNPTKSLMFGSYPYPRNLYAQNTVEFIGVFVKGGQPVQPASGVKVLSGLSKSEWLEYTKQVWNIPVPNRGDLGWGEHPALMPEEIAQRCIRMFTFVGDCVLDPFAGSGTTLKVARELNRNYIGYEVYAHYQSVIDRKVG